MTPRQLFLRRGSPQHRQPTDKTYANQLKAAAILEKIFAQQPQHPGVAHYLIHSYDYPPLLQRPRSRTQLCQDGAGGAACPAHAVTHFYQAGIMAGVIATNRASAMAAKGTARHAQRRAGSSNALHAMDYMLYGHLQLAQDQAAKRIVDDVQAIQTTDAERLDTPTPGGDSGTLCHRKTPLGRGYGLQLHPKELA